MYIATFRFTVKQDNAAAFEALWLGRDSHLKEMPGRVSFDLLKRPEMDGVIL